MAAAGAVPQYATDVTHQAAAAVDHAADVKNRGLEDGGQTPLAQAYATLAVAVELAELRDKLVASGEMYVRVVS